MQSKGAVKLSCRSCGATLTTLFADLGMTPISNAFRTAAMLCEPEQFYPLRAFVCDACRLVQLRDFEVPETHFHDAYAYYSSYTQSWLEHARAYAKGAIERFKLDARSLVVEVASNDGYLLQYFLARGIPSLGIDPAANCAAVAKQKHELETIVTFFNKATALALAKAGRRADLMVANNVLAHVPDLNQFVAAFPILLKPEGVVTFEFPHLLNVIRGSQFDT